MNEGLQSSNGHESIEERKEQALAYAIERLKGAESKLDNWEDLQIHKPLENSRRIEETRVVLEDIVFNLEEDIKLIKRGDKEVINEYWQESQNQLFQAG